MSPLAPAGGRRLGTSTGAQPSLLLDDGHSIANQNGVAGCSSPVYGCSPTPGSDSNRFPAQALSQMSLTTKAANINIALGGNTCQQRINAAPQYADIHYSSERPFNVLTFNCGINDFKQGVTDENVTYALILQYVAARKAVGWTVIVLTVEDDAVPSPNATFETYRHNLNTLIRNGAVANGYTVLDIEIGRAS